MASVELRGCAALKLSLRAGTETTTSPSTGDAEAGPPCSCCCGAPSPGAGPSSQISCGAPPPGAGPSSQIMLRGAPPPAAGPSSQNMRRDCCDDDCLYLTKCIGCVGCCLVVDVTGASYVMADPLGAHADVVHCLTGVMNGVISAPPEVHYAAAGCCIAPCYLKCNGSGPAAPGTVMV